MASVNLKNKNYKLVVSVGRIVGEDYIGIRNANGDVCDVSKAEYLCKIYPEEIEEFKKGLGESLNGEDFFEYKKLIIHKDQVENLGKSLDELKNYVGKRTLVSRTI